MVCYVQNKLIFFPFFLPYRSEKIYYYPEACKSARIYYPVLIKFICWFIHFTPLKKTELKALQKLCGDGVTILFLSLWAISQPCLIPTAKASHSRPTHFAWAKWASFNSSSGLHDFAWAMGVKEGRWGWAWSAALQLPPCSLVPAPGKEAAEPSPRALTRVTQGGKSTGCDPSCLLPSLSSAGTQDLM